MTASTTARPETGAELVPGAAVPWLSDDEQRAWRALVQTTAAVLARLDADLQAVHGLSLGDYEVLAYLSEAPEHTMRMNDLAGRLLLSPSGITRRVDGLVKRGFVERRQCPTDRRGSNAVLTAAGLAALRNAAPTHVRGVRAYFVDQLGPEQLGALAGALAAAKLVPEASDQRCPGV